MDMVTSILAAIGSIAALALLVALLFGGILAAVFGSPSDLTGYRELLLTLGAAAVLSFAGVGVIYTIQRIKGERP